mgnify:CR=1 FL=1
MKNQLKNTPKRVRLVELLPPEGLVKFNNFCNVFKVYFKNQVEAGKAFKVGQATVNRYLSGQIILPIEVAQKINEISSGVIDVEDIYFDYKAFKYDEKMKQKQSDILDTEHKQMRGLSD